MSIHYVSRCISFTPEKSLRTRARARRGDGKPLTTLEPLFRCAIEVQTGMVERNAGLPPETAHRLSDRHSPGRHGRGERWRSNGRWGQYRRAAGRHLRARRRSVSPRKPTGRSRGGSRWPSVDLGPTQLKNIAEPVHVYSLEVGQPAQAKPAVAGPAKGENRGARQSARMVGRHGQRSPAAGLMLLATGGVAWRTGYAPRLHDRFE